MRCSSGQQPTANKGPTDMPVLTCPKCEMTVFRGGYAVWQWIVAIFFFPVGLVALAVGRKPTHCPYCKFIWQA